MSKKIEFIRQAPGENGEYIDRFAYQSLRELQDAVEATGPAGARGIMRDLTNGEQIVVVEPARCNHSWKESDSQFTNEFDTDVSCSKCGMSGSRDNKSGDVFFPAT